MTNPDDMTAADFAIVEVEAVDAVFATAALGAAP